MERRSHGDADDGGVLDDAAAVRQERARQSPDKLRGRLEKTLAGVEVTLLGPAPCPIPRVCRRARHQLLIKAPVSVPLSDVILAARAALPAGRPARATLDVDPSSLL